MKRKTFYAFIIVFLLLGGVLSVNAQEVGEEEQIEFTLVGPDDEPFGPAIGKGPFLMPTLWQSGYLLDFHCSHDYYVLRIVDSTNTVVYSTPVPSSLTQVWLPTYLVGIYRIELLTDSLLFYGSITL